ncbi:MAG: hypothetical protein O3A46_00150 [Candidatus Poribacteria bacterium]|nr:hypothetical protein [Candidatus Poribacteria bacterium]
MATQLDEVLRGIDELTSDEKRHVRRVLDRLLDPPFEITPTQRGLMEAGLLEEPANPSACRDFHRRHKPIKLGGKPVSEQVLEERR